jgi:RNA binding exosome subunit
VLTNEDLLYTLSKIVFRDWQFHTGTMGSGFYIQPSFMAKDRNTQEMKGHHGRKWYVSRYSTDSEVVQTAFKAIVTALEHEAREEFTFRGVAVFGPHFDLNGVVDAVYYGHFKEKKRAVDGQIG